MNARLKENIWLAHASKLLEKNEIESGDALSWAAFHSFLQDESENLPASLIQLLPLFYEKVAATAVMIKHWISMLQRVTEFLNLDHIPVMAFDAPLFALAKFVQ